MVASISTDTRGAAPVGNYVRPWFLLNRHFETIYPALFRTPKPVPYERVRIATPDDDFLDLDFLRQGASQLVIISHGLEGNSQRAYITGMANAFFQQGSDVLAWNYRGCSGEMNRQLRFYHSGATDDLKTVVEHVYPSYQTIVLIGFSLGGNLTLKFLGESKGTYKKITRAIVFSVPLDLHTSCLEIMKPTNWMYQQRFLTSLKKKVIQKSKFHPALKVEGLRFVKTIIDFDDHYTAPVHGFLDAADYYQRCSAIHFLHDIQTKTLIVNAKNDPFLSPACFPILAGNKYVATEWPQHGGHVGFTRCGGNGLYWSELKALAFISQP